MRKHLPIIVGLGLPVLLIVAVILSIYLPRLYMTKPANNFLFLGRTDYSDYKYLDLNSAQSPMLYEYTVKNDQLVLNLVTSPGGRGMERSTLPTVYLYDVKNNTYAAVPANKISSYKITNSKTSPDGYEISRGGGGDTGVIGMFFGGGGSYDYGTSYLIKSSYSQKLNLPADTGLLGGGCYYSSLMECGFVGWVVDGGNQ